MTALQLPADDDAAATAAFSTTGLRITTGRLAFAGIASLGAGAIHATAVGAHADAKQAQWAFAICAIVQLAWGAGALVRSSTRVALAGILVNLAAVVGWVMAKTNGISWIDGLDHKESIQWADGLARRPGRLYRCWQRWPCCSTEIPRTAGQHGFLMGTFTSIVAVATVAGMVTAGSHSHGAAGGHSHGGGAETAAAEEGHSHGTEAGAAAAGAAEAAHVEPVPYDPAQPIDLERLRGRHARAAGSGREPHCGHARRTAAVVRPRVRPGQRLLLDRRRRHRHRALPERRVHRRRRRLDPDRPESLVWDIDRSTGKRTLAAAMFMAKPGVTLDNVPDIGGALTQWHVHDNLCFNDQGKVGGLTNAEGQCGEGLSKGSEIPMIHVWIRPHECGPFAALEGIGGGTIPEGETRLCDHAHGGPVS